MSPPRRRLPLLLLLAALLPPAGPTRAQSGLEALMRDLAAIPSSAGDFIEEKSLPELELPLRTRGELRWAAPDRLEKRTTEPFEERLAVAGSQLSYERPDRGIRQAFSLPEQPEMQALVEAIRGTLAGDLAALRRHYETGFSGAPAGEWRLVLTPVSWRLRGAVQRITMTGRGPRVLGMETEEGGGITRMWITPRP